MTREFVSTTILKQIVRLLMCRGLCAVMLSVFVWGMNLPLSAQSLFRRIDSLLTAKYQKISYDTAYVTRPQTKWTVMARLNLSGTSVEVDDVEDGQHFRSEMEANSKATLSLGVSYRGISLSAAINPAKLIGKYHDYELNLNVYRRDFGFDIIYHDAKNFTGWYRQEGMDRIELPDGMLKVKTLNVNAYYAINNRRFSYPAAFSHTYIQRRSAGSFLWAASGMGQHASFSLEQEQELKFKMMNIGIGAGYGYNFVPGKGWLLHISALPTLVVYSKTSFTLGDERRDLKFKFPDFIVTSRMSVVRQWSKYFLGLSGIFNLTDVDDKDDFNVLNTKWFSRAFFGLRF